MPKEGPYKFMYFAIQRSDMNVITLMLLLQTNQLLLQRFMISSFNAVQEEMRFKFRGHQPCS